MSEQEYAYPFDPTGQLDSNLIVNERHTINPPDYTDFYFVVPLVGPFFRENLVVRHWPSGRVLVDGVDFALGYHFLSASRATANPVYGAISFYDYELTGVVELTYQTLGGPWTINEEKAAELLSNVVSNPRITTWEQVVDMPETFPVIDHEWDLVDLVGAGEVVEKLDLIEDAIRTKAEENATGGVSHINDENNPHNVTATQVGLGLVANYPPASVNEAIEGDLNDRYMTPRRVKEAISGQVNNDFRAHAANIENPHEVTKTQVGLGNVSNYPTADTVTAEAGVSTGHFMTPAVTRSLILAVVGQGVPEHVASTDNPHGVTAAQVGLGSVPNFPMSTNDIARQASSPDYFMSPYHTKLLVDEVALAPLSDHIANRDNPHSVTKVQVGLGSVQNFGLATDSEAQAAVAQNRYMTPYATRLTVEELVGETVSEHIGDRENPHQVTKAQVGLGNVQNYGVATQADALDGSSDTLYMTPRRVKDAIESSVGGAALDHIAAANNPHNVTKGQVGLSNVANFAVANAAQAEAGTSDSHYMTPAKVATYVTAGVGSDLSDHMADRENPHGVTKYQVGLGNVRDYEVASETESRSGDRNDRYMTPLGVKQSIDSYITSSLGNVANRLNELETTQETLVTDTTDHIGDFNNPHQVTAAQVGAYDQAETDSLLDQKLGVDARAADSERFDGLTRDELVSSIETVAADTYVTQEEITILGGTLSASFEDAMWGLMGNNVIRLEQGDLSTVFTATDDIVYSIVGDENNRWLAGGSGGKLGVSDDNLLSWSTLDLGITDDIVHLNYLDGGRWQLSTLPGDIYVSLDGGETFTAADLGDTTANPAFYIFDFLDLTDGRSLGVGASAMRIATTDKLLWDQVVDLSALGEIASAAADSNDLLYLATSTGLYTWTAADGASLVAAVDDTVPFTDVHIDKDDHVIAVDELGKHYRYSPVNGGWQVLAHELPVRAFATDSYGLWAAIGENSEVWRSIDGGRLWNRVPTSPSDEILTAIGSSADGWTVAGVFVVLYIAID
jgi:hypothetical protein